MKSNSLKRLGETLNTRQKLLEATKSPRRKRLEAPNKDLRLTLTHPSLQINLMDQKTGVLIYQKTIKTETRVEHVDRNHLKGIHQILMKSLTS